jgi:hypothetical protein
MRLTKKIPLLLLFAIIAIQFVQPARNKDGQVQAMDISKTIIVPERIDALLKTACYDCHSNHTNYPWYAYVQPIGWILNNHIRNGKQQLNFNEFGSYSLRRQQSKLKSIASQVNDNAMPLSSYTWMHKNARLSKEDKALIVDWATKAKDSIAIRN